MGKFVETIRKDEIKLKIEVLSPDIIHIQAGGIDGYQDSLLNKYQIINSLDINSVNLVDNIININKTLKLKIKKDLSFEILKNNNSLLKTTSDYVPGTFKTVYGNKGCNVKFETDKDEKFIGFGDQFRNRKTGLLLNNLAGKLWINNQTSYIPVPIFMSSKGYGIFFNTTRKLLYDFSVKEKNINSFKIEKEYMNIYIFTGENYYDLLNKYTLLTGRTSMPPFYSLGIWLIAHGTIRHHELLDIAYNMRQEEIPCDILGLEPGWMETIYDLTTEKKWNDEKFPYYSWAIDRKDSFINTLKQMGYHFELWLCNDYDHTWEE